MREILFKLGSGLGILVASACVGVYLYYRLWLAMQKARIDRKLSDLEIDSVAILRSLRGLEEELEFAACFDLSHLETRAQFQIEIKDTIKTLQRCAKGAKLHLIEIQEIQSEIRSPWRSIWSRHSATSAPYRDHLIAVVMLFVSFAFAAVAWGGFIPESLKPIALILQIPFVGFQIYFMMSVYISWRASW